MYALFVVGSSQRETIILIGRKKHLFSSVKSTLPTAVVLKRSMGLFSRSSSSKWRYPSTSLDTSLLPLGQRVCITSHLGAQAVILTLGKSMNLTRTETSQSDGPMGDPMQLHYRMPYRLTHPSNQSIAPLSDSYL